MSEEVISSVAYKQGSRLTVYRDAVVIQVIDSHAKPLRLSEAQLEELGLTIQVERTGS